MRVIVVHEGVHSVDYHRLIVPFAHIGKSFDEIKIFSKNHCSPDRRHPPKG